MGAGPWETWREPFRIQSIEDLKRMYREDLSEELEIDEERPTLFGIPVVIDESVPRGEIHLGRVKWEYPS